MNIFIQALKSTSVAPSPLPEPVWELPSNSVRITLLTGQSNSSGNGYNSEALSSETDSTSALKIWRNTSFVFQDLNISSGNNYPNVGSTHGIELGVSLAQEAQKTYPLYLAKYGIGGTEINEHIKGGWCYQTFYNFFVAKAINNLLASGKRVFVDLVFLQGENNTEFQYLTDNYANELTNWITLWRVNLGANLPINFIEIYQRNSRTQQINDIFHAKAATDPNIRVISASTLTTNDGIHYSYASLKTIANNYYNTMLSVTPLEIITPLYEPTDIIAPATMTLNSVTQVGSTLTMVANLNGGDAVTSNSNLYYKIYCGFPVFYITGTDVNDPNVSLSGSVVTITNIPITQRYTYIMSIVSVDEEGWNSNKSNTITIVPV